MDIILHTYEQQNIGLFWSHSALHAPNTKPAVSVLCDISWMNHSLHYFTDVNTAPKIVLTKELEPIMNTRSDFQRRRIYYNVTMMLEDFFPQLWHIMHISYDQKTQNCLED